MNAGTPKIDALDLNPPAPSAYGLRELAYLTTMFLHVCFPESVQPSVSPTRPPRHVNFLRSAAAAELLYLAPYRHARANDARGRACMRAQQWLLGTTGGDSIDSQNYIYSNFSKQAHGSVVSGDLLPFGPIPIPRSTVIMGFNSTAAAVAAAADSAVQENSVHSTTSSNATIAASVSDTAQGQEAAAVTATDSMPRKGKGLFLSDEIVRVMEPRTFQKSCAVTTATGDKLAEALEASVETTATSAVENLSIRDADDATVEAPSTAAAAAAGASTGSSAAAASAAASAAAAGASASTGSDAGATAGKATATAAAAAAATVAGATVKSGHGNSLLSDPQAEQFLTVSAGVYVDTSCIVVWPQVCHISSGRFSDHAIQ